MRPIDVIINEVKSADQARRDADLAAHHAVNRQIGEMFDALNDPIVGVKFDRPFVDRIDAVNFSVRRLEQTVCIVQKQDGKIKLKSGQELGSLVAYYEDPDPATQRVLELLQEHQRKFPQ